MARGKHRAQAERREEQKASEAQHVLRSRVSALEEELQEARRRADDRDVLEAAVARLSEQLKEACSDELATMHEKYGELSAAFAKLSWSINTIQSNWDTICDVYMNHHARLDRDVLAAEALLEHLDGVRPVMMLHVNTAHTEGLSHKAVVAIEHARRRRGLVGWRNGVEVEGKPRRMKGKTIQATPVYPGEQGRDADQLS